MKFLAKLARRAVRRWKNRAKAGWKRELSYWVKHPFNRRHAFGLLMLLVSGPFMWYIAYNAGLVVLLSFSFSAFMAISYATFFSSPFVFVLIYIGVLIGQAANAYFFQAKDAAFAGDLTSAALVGLVGIGIWLFSNRLKAGNVGPTQVVRLSRKSSSRSGRSGVRGKARKGRRKVRA